MKKILFIISFTIIFFSLKICLAQWQQTNGPLGGNVACIAFNGPYVFAGTQGGLIYRSEDKGKNWTYTCKGLVCPDIFSLGMNSAGIYAGTGNGLYFSSNNGDNWQYVKIGINNYSILSLVVNDTCIFAGTYMHGVFLTKDNGAHWVSANYGINTLTIYSLTICEKTVYAGTEAGLFKSLDNGKTWIDISNIFSCTEKLCIKALATDGPNIYVCSSGYGVVISKDKGATWSGSKLEGDYTTIAAKDGELYVGAWYATAKYAIVYSSKDNGETWNESNKGLNAVNIFCIAIKDSLLYAGSNMDAMFISEDKGNSWKASNTGLINSSVVSLTHNGTDIFAGTYEGGVFKSSDNGLNWTAVNKGIEDPNNIARLNIYSLTTSRTEVYAGIQNFGIFMSTDKGENWTAINKGLPNNASIFSMSSTYKYVYAGMIEGVYKKTGADSWTEINNGLIPADGPSSYDIIAQCSNGKDVFADSGGKIFRTQNEGDSWELANEGLPNCGARGFAIKDSTIYAGTDYGVYLSEDLGKSWRGLNSKMNYVVFALAMSGNYVFAATGQGVYYSNDKGLNWKLINDGFHENRIQKNHETIGLTSMMIKDSYIYVGTWWGEGVWKRPLSDIVGIEESQKNKEELEIKISPNPVNQSAIINYQLKGQEQSTIKLYDMTGREIATILEDIKDKGEYTLKYNTKKLAKGLYLLKLTASNEQRVLKFIKD